jgi:hypothetical protein
VTQEEWDRSSPEKKVLHQFLAAMSECFAPGTKRKLSGPAFVAAMQELVQQAKPSSADTVTK